MTLSARDAHSIVDYYSLLGKTYYKEVKKWVDPKAEGDTEKVPQQQALAKVATTCRLLVLNVYEKALDLMEMERNIEDARTNAPVARSASGIQTAASGDQEAVLKTTLTEEDKVRVTRHLEAD